jgi:hypothetical protein
MKAESVLIKAFLKNRFKILVKASRSQNSFGHKDGFTTLL